MKKIMIFFIKGYKKNISVYFEKWGVKCKFFPTCSEYAIQAITKYGGIKGGFLTLKRVLRCNPFSKGGYDPLK